MEKKECKSCKCFRGMELFRGKNLTCDACLEKKKRYSERHPEKVREYASKYERENPRDRREYMKEYNQREKECEICKCKMKIGHWSRHIKTKIHMENVGKMMGGGDENDDGKMDKPT